MGGEFEGGDELFEVSKPAAIARRCVGYGVGRGDPVARRGQLFEGLSCPGDHSCEAENAGAFVSTISPTLKPPVVPTFVYGSTAAHRALLGIYHQKKAPT